MSIKNFIKSQKGFTLIEITITIVIVAIISIIGFVAYRGHVEKSKVTEAMAVVRAIADAHIVHFREKGDYTKDINNLLLEIESQSSVGTSNGYTFMKGKYFTYGTGPLVTTPSTSECIAYGYINNRYCIYITYNDNTNTPLSFHAYAFSGATDQDKKIVNDINQKGRL